MMSSSSNDNEIYLAAIEGGGTTFVVSVARVVKSSRSSNEEELLQIGSTKIQILNTTTIPPKDDNTGEILNYTPAQILDETCIFLTKHLPSSGQYSAVGIATFGPAGVNPDSKNYGTILPGSPKREWRNVDILTPIAKACGLENDMTRVLFDTDVNAPAIADFQQRHACATKAAQLTSLSYITIGTGVGVGLIINSQPVHGLLHPEGGHVAVQPLENDTFAGYSWGSEKSPYGGVGTVEGICSSVALTERYLQMSSDNDNKNENNIDSAQTREILSTLPDTHEVWDHAANAIANLCVSILLLTSCEKIVLGGGIMKRTMLYKMVRERVCTLLNGYLDSVDELSSVEKLENVICESSWEKLGSGLVGAYALALKAYDTKEIQSSVEVVSGKKGKRRNDDDDGQHDLFTSGVLAGIGLSFGCMLLTSLLSRGSRHRQ